MQATARKFGKCIFLATVSKVHMVRIFNLLIGVFFGFISGKYVLKLYSQGHWVPILMTSSTYLCKTSPQPLSLNKIQLEDACSITKVKSRKTTDVGQHFCFTEQDIWAHRITTSLHLHACMVSCVGFGSSVGAVFPLPLMFYFKVLTRKHRNVNLEHEGCHILRHNGINLRFE